MIAPRSWENQVGNFPVKQVVYYEEGRLRETVEEVIKNKGGVTVSDISPQPLDGNMNRIRVHFYLRGKNDYNSKLFFKPLLDQFPHIMFGNPLSTRFENLYLNDHFWTTSEGQELKGSLYSEEPIFLILFSQRKLGTEY